MEKESTIFDTPTDEAGFIQLITDLTTKVYTTGALYASAHFFFNYYTSTLAEYRTNFSGPRFSGGEGPFADAGKVAQYEAATQGLTEVYADAAFTGGDILNLNEDIICATFCVPPTGPPPGSDETPCIQIPSSIVPGKLLCEVPVETAAALSFSTQDVLDGYWDVASSTTNDGFF